MPWLDLARRRSTWRPYLDGAVAHDLAEPCDVVILLDGSAQVAVVLGFGASCQRISAKCALVGGKGVKGTA